MFWNRLQWASLAITGVAAAVTFARRHARQGSEANYAAQTRMLRLFAAALLGEVLVIVRSRTQLMSVPFWILTAILLVDGAYALRETVALAQAYRAERAA